MIRRKDRKNNRINALSEAQNLAFAPLSFQAVATMLDIGLLKLLDDKYLSLEEIMQHGDDGSRRHPHFPLLL